jgi:stress response protein YsnF
MAPSPPQQPPEFGARRLPVVEERAIVGKQPIPTASVRLTSSVVEESKLVTECLAQVRVSVERHAVDRLEEEPPSVRTEPGRTIVPVFEEVLVKRFRVTEEVHLVTRRREAPVEQEVSLRRTQVMVERRSAQPDD